MSWESWLYFGSCVLATVSSAYLILAPNYSDGVTGRMSLIAIVVGGVVVAANSAEGWVYVVHHSTLVTQVGVAGLTTRRVVRLLCDARMRRRQGVGT